LIAYVEHALASGWCLCYLGGAYDVTSWSNLTFCNLFGYVIMSFSTWYGVWQHMMIRLSLKVVSSPPSFLFTLGKMHDYPLFFFQFISSIIISHIFVFILVLILFILFFVVFLLKFFWLSISSFNQSFYCFIFFLFNPHSFDLFFLLLKLFSNSI